MQQEYGYQVANQTIVRLPFDLSLLPEARQVGFSAVKRIAFIGKYLQLKGWPDFVRALALLAPGQIQEIVSLAPGAPSDEDAATLGSLASYSWTHLSHQRLLEYISGHLEDTLFVVPSRGRVFPTSCWSSCCLARVSSPTTRAEWSRSRTTRTMSRAFLRSDAPCPGSQDRRCPAAPTG